MPLVFRPPSVPGFRFSSLARPRSISVRGRGIRPGWPTTRPHDPALTAQEPPTGSGIAAWAQLRASVRRGLAKAPVLGGGPLDLHVDTMQKPGKLARERLATLLGQVQVLDTAVTRIQAERVLLLASACISVQLVHLSSFVDRGQAGLGGSWWASLLALAVLLRIAGGRSP